MTTQPTYDSYEANVIGNLVQMLSMSTTFQLLVGVTTALAAVSFIVEVDAGDDVDNQAQQDRKGAKFTMTMSDGTQLKQPIPVTQPFGWVQAGEIDHEPITPDTFVHRGDFIIGVFLPFIPGEAPPWRMRRARNQQGLIRADFLAQRAQPGALWRCGAHCRTPVLVDDTGPFRQTVHCAIEGEWNAP